MVCVLLGITDIDALTYSKTLKVDLRCVKKSKVGTEPLQLEPITPPAHLST